MHESLNKFYKNGWIMYCPNCDGYVKQSDPQDFSGHKQVVIDDEPCTKCNEEVKEAQAIMGRLE